MKSATQVVVDCAGVGYDVQISLHTYADVEPLSEGFCTPTIWFVKMRKCSLDSVRNERKRFLNC